MGLMIWPTLTVKSSVKSETTEGFHMNFTVISCCERAKCEISLTNPASRDLDATDRDGVPDDRSYLFLDFTF